MSPLCFAESDLSEPERHSLVDQKVPPQRKDSFCKVFF